MMSNFVKFTDEKLGETYFYTKHSSGLDIYVFPKKMTHKTAFLGTKFGSFYEKGAECDGVVKNYSSGIAHFLEHKLFSSEDGVDAISKLAEIGADANAYTTTNKTVYMFSCTDNFYQSLAGLIDFVYHPYFTDDSVEREKGIITQEIRMFADSPYDSVTQNLLKAMYGDCVISRDVCGSEESISKITAKELYDCYNTFYSYSNMALVICGNVDENEVLEVVNKALPKMEERPIHTLSGIPSDDFVVSPYAEKRMSVGQPILEIGIKDKKPSGDVKKRFERDVALTILDEIIFSRAGELYSELFEGGLINEAYSYGYSVNKEVAFHSIYAESDQPELVFEKVKSYIKKLQQNGISEKDFSRCKKVMLAEFIRDFDSVDDIANLLINFVFEGLDVFEYRKIIENTSFSDVCECLRDSFDERCFSLSVIKNNN